MTDTIIIYKILELNIPNHHPALYQYVMGQQKNKISVIMRITELIYPIFDGVFDISKVRGVSKEYLENKSIEYHKGDIQIKSIY